MIYILVKLEEGGGTSFQRQVSLDELTEILNSGVDKTFKLKELGICLDRTLVYNFNAKLWTVYS